MYCYDENADHSVLLTAMTALLQKESGLTAQLGAELEFYLMESKNDEALLASISKHCCEQGVPVGAVEKERGTRQYELQLAHHTDALLLAKQLVQLRTIVENTAASYGSRALFDAKPFADEPGSALHIHISLLDSNHRNQLQKHGTEESDTMRYALGGLCRLLPESMVFFSPKEEDYQRFVPHMDAPTTVSWGGNNRTTTLRIPLSDAQNRRIEHRAPAASSNPYLVITAILAGIHYGIREKILPPKRIYGNSYDEQYALPALPSTLEKAKALFEQSLVLGKYFL